MAALGLDGGIVAAVAVALAVVYGIYLYAEKAHRRRHDAQLQTFRRRIAAAEDRDRRSDKNKIKNQ